jgi:hypothetical protein
MKLVWFINEVVSSRSVNVEVVESLVSGREGKREGPESRKKIIRFHVMS